MKKWLAPLALASLFSCRALAGAPLYSLVEGLDEFDGSAAAWQLLQTNGFVVADPTFKHIYDSYIDSPLPVLITVDSAWHTYHLLLEYGLGKARVEQGRRLAAFSRRLTTVAREQSQIDGQDFAALSAYAAIGLGLQDDDFAATLPEGEKRIIDTLRSGVGTAAPGLGFSLAARSFKPSNAPSMPPEDASCFAARQWYATVVFRLSDPRETRLALCLSWLIHHDAELSPAWSELAGLDDAIIGPATDGSVPSYLAALKNLAPSEINAHLGDLRRALDTTLPDPVANDQLLGPDDATRASKGFRLLPPRRLPRWADAAGSAEAVRKALSAPPPDSIVGQSLRLLTHLQTPLPDAVPPAMRTAAWADLQLWTALAGWAEIRRIAGAAAQTNGTPREPVAKQSGVVEPYPQFFAGLAEVSRRAAALLVGAGAGQTFNSLMGDFAAMCDRLAALAQKQLDGAATTADDAKWIQNYGVTLQHFRFDNDESDTGEFPVISRLGYDPARSPAPCAWVAQPQALYVILPTHGRLRLFCGAVLSYRQGIHADASVSPPNDTPPAPDFTSAFRTEKTVSDLLADLNAESSGRDGFGDQQSTLQQLDGRLTDADLPELIRSLGANEEPSANGPSPVAGLIAKLEWKPYQTWLLQLMETNEAALDPAASILGQQPEALDAAWLCANFDRQPPLVRALYCHLLGKHGPALPTGATLGRATCDADAEVRWSAITALRELRLSNDLSIAALEQRLTDTNENVAAAAARALGKFGAASAAPLLLTNLQARLAAPAPTDEHPDSRGEIFRVLRLFADDPDMAEDRDAVRQSLSFPAFGNRPAGNPAIDSFAQALGDLKYQPAVATLFGLLDTDYAPSAVKALDSLAQERVRGRLIDIACDQTNKLEARDRALQLLMQTSPSNDDARRLAPLLDETVEVRIDPPRGPRSRQFAWRLCDRAVQVIAHLLGKPPTRFLPMPIRQNEPTPDVARQWLTEAARK